MRKFFIGFLVVVALAYLGLFLARAGNDTLDHGDERDIGMYGTVAIFGATGTIGDGLLKAALNDPEVKAIRVITRRPSPRIEAGVATGRVTMTIHKDYLDYVGLLDSLADVDAVFWAIGISSRGVDEQKYREIHVDYPSRFLTEWMTVSQKPNASFHYVSGSGAKAESRMMWAREKAHAESQLANLAAGSNVRVVSYRPSAILPTEAEANLGHRLLYAVLSPIKAAVAAESIGRGMLEVSARHGDYPNGTILENPQVISLDTAYLERQP